MTDISKQVDAIFRELMAAEGLLPGEIVVLGCSTSEILGENIGKSGSLDIGHEVVSAAAAVCHDFGVFLAVQACEHINRALVVEAKCAQIHKLEIVNVKPTPAAGGACASAAAALFAQPVVVEHITAKAGVDIGDTHIGMHVKFVQVPFRPSAKKVGQAHVTALTWRPKLIGGARAQY